MPAILCRLVKITAQKKLMVKVTEETNEILEDRVHTATLNKFGTTGTVGSGLQNIKRPHFILDGDDGNEAYFAMIALDKYDKQRMRVFEHLLKKDISVEYKMATYDFVPDGEETALKGVNLQLCDVRLYKGKKPLFADYKKLEESDSEADDAAERAEARETSTATELNAEEQAIDENHLINLAMAVAASPTLPLAPPPLIRQQAITEPRPIMRRRAQRE